MVKKTRETNEKYWRGRDSIPIAAMSDNEMSITTRDRSLMWYGVEQSLPWSVVQEINRPEIGLK